MRKILVPTDFSTQANCAVTWAAEIASKNNAEILFLHIIDTFGTKGKSASECLKGNELSENEKKKLAARVAIAEENCQLAKNQCATIKVRHQIVLDNIHKQIAECITREDIDLIVMGSRGTGEGNFLVGSNTERIIRIAPCPVFTVKGAPKLQLQNVCFASDFKDVPDQVINSLLHLQSLFGFALHLLKVITPANFEPSALTKQTILRFVEKHNISYYTANIYNYYTEYEGILEFCKETESDLIAMVTHGNTGILHMLMGSIAEDVANHSTVPVLTFNQFY